MAIQDSVAERFELSPQQRRLWLLGGSDGAFEARAEVRIEGEVDRQRLIRAAERVCRRHEVLRTTFRRASWMKVPAQEVEAAMAPIWVEPGGLGGAFELEAGPVLSLALAAGGARGGGAILELRLPALCADLRTLGNLVGEVAGAYAGEGGSGEIFQYADFAAWQNELLAADDESRALAAGFWARRDLEAIRRQELPAARGDGPFNPRFLRVPLPAGVAAALEGVAAEAGSDLPTALAAAWEAVLWHLLGRSGVTVGWSFDGRKYDDLAEALGLYARMLPVAGGARASLPFAELVAAVGRSAAEAGEWQEYGVLDAGEEPATRRFAFVFEHAALPTPCRAGGATFTTLRCRALPEPFTVRLSAVRGEGGTALELGYDAGRLAGVEAARLAHQLAALMAAAAARPGAPVEALGLLDRSGRHRLLVELNDSRRLRRAAATETVHGRIAAQAAATPEAVAVVSEERELTYGDLAASAAGLARRLSALGVGPESRVAVYLERSPELVVAMLAVLEAGGAYVPLDPVFPAERLAMMLEDAGPAALVTTPELARRLPETGIPVVSVDAAAEAPEPEAAATPIPAAGPGNLVYVLFTSGSTGRPKGVAVEHRQLLNYADAVLARLDPPPGAGWATVSTFAADLGNTMVFPALLTGGCLHLISQERASSPEALSRYFRHHGPDYFKLVPSHLGALLTTVSPEEVLPRRCLFLGGEAATWELVDRVTGSPAAPMVLNHYGPTETTVGVLAGAFDPPGPSRPGSPHLGRPLANCRAVVVDRSLAPVAAGVPGEIAVGGAGVARGYLGRPAATAERFVPDPLAGSGERLYRTGDLARVTPAGGIEFLGRTDHQVKLRGFRIELGEVEAAVAAHPGVRELAVIAREDRPGDRRLVAYYTPARDTHATAAELRGFVQERLPDYMVPSAFVELRALPLTANGKLDRAALPPPDRSHLDLGEAYAEPRSAAERALAEIWAGVLGVERVGVHDSFFELGGDSILVIQAVARAARAGLHLRPRDFFRYQSVAELAAVAGSGESVADRGPATGSAPLTPAQHRFVELGLREPHHWNQTLFYECLEPVAAGPLAGAVRELVEHHDALRLRFAETDGGRTQTYAPPGPPAPFSLVDLSGLAPTAATGALEAAAAGVQRSLDLAAGPLLRVVLFRPGPGASERLLLTIHHLVVDGVSWRVLLEDLLTAYRVLQEGGRPALPPRTTAFGDWARGLVVAARDAAAELGYWRGVLERAGTPLPVDLRGGANTAASARTVLRTLGAEATQRLLQEVPQAYRTEINDALLAALARAVSGWTGEPLVGVELEGHGREEETVDGADLSRTVGWFTCHYPVALDAGSGDPGELLQAVKEELRRVPNRGIGFGLQRYLGSGDASELAALPSPAVGFNYLGQVDRTPVEDAPFRGAPESPGPARDPASPRGRLLAVSGRVAGGSLEMSFSYSEALHRPATVEALADRYMEALAEIIDHCRTAERTATPSDFPLVELDASQLAAIARSMEQGEEDE